MNAYRSQIVKFVVMVGLVAEFVMPEFKGVALAANMIWLWEV